MDRFLRNLLWIGLLIVATVILLPPLLESFDRPTRRLKYSEFLEALDGQLVRSVTLDEGSVRGVMIGPLGPTGFSVELPPQSETETLRRLQETKAVQPSLEFETARRRRIPRDVQQLLVSVLVPLGAILLLWVLFWRQAAPAPAVPAPFFNDFTRFGAAYEDARTEAQELWQRLTLGRHSCVKAVETLPELHVRAGDLLVVRPGSIPGEGDLVLLDDGGVPRVRRCAYGEEQPAYTGGPTPSGEAEVVGKVELVVRRA